MPTGINKTIMIRRTIIAAVTGLVCLGIACAHQNFTFYNNTDIGTITASWVLPHVQSGWDGSRTPSRIGRSEYIHWDGETGYDWYELRAHFEDGYVVYWTDPFNLSGVSNVYLTGEEGDVHASSSLGRWQPSG
jgi:hypothetical protein